MPYGSDPTTPPEAQPRRATLSIGDTGAGGAAAPKSSLALPPEADTFFGRVRAAEGTAKGDGFVIYGGQPFKPGKDHPGSAARVPGPYGPTSAAGPGQWEEDTWNGLKPRFRERFGRDPLFSDLDDQKAMTWLKGAERYGGEDRLKADIAAGKLDTSKLSAEWRGFGGGGGYGKDPSIAAGKWRVSDKAIGFEQGRSNSSVVWMSPADYLAMTPESDDKAEPKRRSLLKSLALGEEIEAIPTLDAREKNGKVEIFDQDGRNRAKVAQQEGVDLIPVAIHGAGKEPTWITDMRGNVRPFNFAPVPKKEAPANLTGMPGLDPHSYRNLPSMNDIGTGLRTALGGGAELMTHLVPSGVENAVNKFNNTLADAGVPLARLPEGGVAQLERERMQKLAAERGPSPTTGEMIGEGIGGALGAAAAIPAGATSLAALTAGGAIGGALAPTEGGNFWEEKAKQAGIGAVTGLGLGAAGRVAGNVIAPTILPAAQRLMDKGVRLLPGQLRGGWLREAEQKSTSIPFSGSSVAAAQRRAIEDWNRSVYDDVLKFAGEKYAGSEVGTKGVAEVEKKLSSRYDKLKPYIQFKADQTYNQNVSNLKSLVSGLPNDLAKAFNNILSRVDRMMGPQRVMDGQTFKEVESELSSAARDWHFPTNTALEKKVGDAISSLVGELRENIERHSPAVAKELKDLNTAWAAFVRLREASTRRPTSLGIFTPGDLLASEKKLAGRNIFARGDGLLQKEAVDAEQVIGSRYPDSGTAGRANQLAEIAELFTMLATHPMVAAGQIGGHVAHGLSYTSPGLALLRGLAGSGFPQVRKALAQIPRATSNALAPSAGFFAGNAVAPQ